MGRLQVPDERPTTKASASSWARRTVSRRPEVRKIANIDGMSKSSPVGRSVEEASRRRAGQSEEYRRELDRLRPYEEIARQVIALRMRHNLSQEALAERTGTTKSAISRLESGQHGPTVATLEKIAAAFGGYLVISFEVPGQPAP
jgi:ribosome-binding protein aMBF1 (putative translation factor)